MQGARLSRFGPKPSLDARFELETFEHHAALAAKALDPDVGTDAIDQEVEASTGVFAAHSVLFANGDFHDHARAEARRSSSRSSMAAAAGSSA